MKILALELSTGRAGLAWLDAGIEFSCDWANDRKNSGLFFQHLKSVTAKFGLPERIIVGLGPGSYAGVRIAISAAIGLRAASGAELIGYPSICAMAAGADDYVVVGDARRRSFYLGRVCNRELAGEIELYDKPELETELVNVKSNLPVLSSDSPPHFGAQLSYPSAEILAHLARAADRTFSSPPLQPIYLREPHITIPKANAGPPTV